MIHHKIRVTSGSKYVCTVSPMLIITYILWRVDGYNKTGVLADGGENNNYNLDTQYSINVMDLMDYLLRKSAIIWNTVAEEMLLSWQPN